MTTQDLQNNRNLIISIIKKDYGQENLKQIMISMLNMISMADSNNVEDYIVEVAEDTLDLVKKGKTADVKAQEYFEDRREEVRNIYSRKFR